MLFMNGRGPQSRSHSGAEAMSSRSRSMSFAASSALRSINSTQHSQLQGLGVPWRKIQGTAGIISANFGIILMYGWLVVV